MNRYRELILTLSLTATAAVAHGQDSSLLLAPPPSNAAAISPDVATLENSSFIYNSLPPEAQQRPLQVNDIIRVLVDYRAATVSDGSSETRKTGAYSSVLTDWLKFDGKSIFPAPQERGDPTIAGTLNSQSRAEADIESSESVSFLIAAKIVDIRPNGDFVIEARNTVQINEEEWETYVTGTVSRQFVGPDRTVRHSDMTDLRIRKREIGAVRDGYNRGWLARIYGKYKAF